MAPPRKGTEEDLWKEELHRMGLPSLDRSRGFDRERWNKRWKAQRHRLPMARRPWIWPAAAAVLGAVLLTGAPILHALSHRPPNRTPGIAAWALLPDGRFLETRNDGRAWQDMTPPGLPSRTGTWGQGTMSGFALDPHHAWIVLSSPTVSEPTRLKVLRMRDGRTFLDISTLAAVVDRAALAQGSPDATRPAVVATRIGFSDDQNGWMIVLWSGAQGMIGTDLYRTTDGGRTWANAPLSPSLQGAIQRDRGSWITGESFRSPTDGWLTYTMFAKDMTSLKNGCPFTVPLLHTTDGGRTWHLQSLGEKPCTFGTAYPPVFFGATKRMGVLLVALAGPSPKVEVYGTRDGGVTWSPLAGFAADLTTQSPLPPDPIAFLGPTHGWVLDAADHAIYRTTDLGRWTRLPLSVPTTDITSMTFVSGKVGWIVAGSHVYTTGDGGESFARSY